VEWDRLFSGRLTAVSVLGVVAALAVPGIAQATQRVVDDDHAQCPSAGFTSIQAAIDAASPGDTISICEGTYIEGTGGLGTNALTIDKPLTIRGANFGLVQILPNSAGGSRIAELAADGPTADTALRNATGNIISVTAGPTKISGVTIEANNVYHEAAVAFINAAGSFTNSRLTNLWFTDSTSKPTGAGVVAHSDVGSGDFPVTVSGDLLESYNRYGVLLDSRSIGSNTPSGSHVVGTLTNDRIEGLGVQGDVQQRGVQISFGASGTVTHSVLSDNFLSTTRRDSGGAYLVDADVPNSAVTDNNVKGNGFGVVNVDAAGVNSTSIVDARRNWWGSQQGPSAEATPGTNGGDPITNTSVLAAPFQFVPYFSPIVPGQDADLPPTVAMTAPANGAIVQPASPVGLSATASDDVGVSSVTFMKGATVLGVDTTAPYTGTYTPTLGEGGSDQTITAVATDTVGQQRSSSVSVHVAGGQVTPPGPVESLLVKLVSPGNHAFFAPAKQVSSRADASASQGVSAVTFLLGNRKVCTATTAPYVCNFLPAGDDVGVNTLTAVVADTKGSTASDSLAVRVGRFTTRAVSARSRPKTSTTAVHTFRVSGRVGLPARVTRALGCSGGIVELRIKIGRTTVRRVRTRLSGTCAYRGVVKFRLPARFAGVSTVHLATRFLGNRVLLPRSAKTLTLGV
jgi:hypothetical protein